MGRSLLPAFDGQKAIVEEAPDSQHASMKWLAVSWAFVAVALGISAHACMAAHTCLPIPFYGAVGAVLVTAATAGVRAQRQPVLPRVMLTVFALVTVAAGIRGIPLLRGLCISGHETTAVGEIREFISSEATYESLAEGVFGPPSCLGEPGRCIPGLPAEYPPLLHPWPRPAEWRGYRYTFYPGPAESKAEQQSTSFRVSRYAYVAEPLVPGRSGKRAFCGDNRGVICNNPVGSPPRIDATGGRCPAWLETLGGQGSPCGGGNDD